MGKRSSFERVERDFYRTPLQAVVPLLPHLRHEYLPTYVEPCAGDGALIDALALCELTPACHGAYDIEPQRWDIERGDALATEWPKGLYITNPPWDRKILHPLIVKLTENGGKCWLLFDADWLHTKQSIPFLPRLRKVVSVGRVKWIPDSKTTGKDNCCWYLFTAPSDEPTLFHGRVSA